MKGPHALPPKRRGRQEGPERVIRASQIKEVECMICSPSHNDANVRNDYDYRG